MIYVLGVILFIGLIYGPSLWVKYILNKHSNELEGMPGNGGDLAKHFIERFELEGVKVEEGKESQDHYNPETKTVSLSPTVYRGKSLTAVAVATHEIGHAIQFTRNEPVSKLRKKYMGKAIGIRRIGSVIMTCIPLVALIFKTPSLMLIMAIAGVVTMLASVLMYVAILPEEYDASFKKALPILEEGYVPSDYLPAIRQVLRAAAFTYVAGALADVFRLWRWFRVLK